METPKFLLPALRQYQHNDCSGTIAGFDHDITSKIVNLLEKTVEAQSRMLISYRTGKIPPDWVFDATIKGREFGLKI